MAVPMISDLYDYHRWANRRLFEVAAGLGEAVTREMGPQWSYPTLKGMFAHIHAADHVWLARWKGSSPGRLLGDADFASVAELRTRWDALEAEQGAFVAGLSEAALGPLLQHVVNPATHHRSEAATMITMISGSPPDTGINTYRVAVVKG
jgi:uncharacterized damage-inducible protein DinB